jgi:hypothetical protein
VGDDFCSVELIVAAVRDKGTRGRVGRERRSTIGDDHNHPLGIENGDPHWLRPKGLRQFVTRVVEGACPEQFPSPNQASRPLLQLGLVVARAIGLGFLLDLTVSKGGEQKYCRKSGNKSTQRFSHVFSSSLRPDLVTGGRWKVFSQW